MPNKILIVEDTESLALLYQSYLIPTGMQTEIAYTGQEALDYLANNKPDLIMLDVMLPDMSGMDILAQLPANDRPRVVVLTAHASKELAVDAIRYGAADFIEKPVDAERFRITVNNALKLNSLSETVEKYQSRYENGRFCELIGSSAPMQSVYQIISNAANSKATVFITGESGTGKELCARAIHQCSERNKKPFIAINCAAIPKDLIESEIFGHVKGAFTGATNNREGAAGMANGGTLFLDELCEMDLNLQSKLLRFIQTGCFQKVGSEQQQQVDVRFVCATNRDPWLEVQAGRFREDLYYRLYVIPVQLPPLRQRGQDVIQIAEALFSRIASEEGQKFEGLSDDAKHHLMAYSWPGNVRQLENMIRNTVVLNNTAWIEKRMFPPFPQTNTAHEGTVAAQVSAPATLSTPSIETTNLLRSSDIEPLWIVEKRYIEKAIAACNDNVPKAAALLDISPSTIYRKMKTWEQMAEQAY
ncbi:sigma-54-dependent transcriptional regulator [Pseudoalteromonas piratica]|uniref:Fis family transcriptional regulator n=1 Tax=Pseudoalteromonas piratica TaxID=1348114 RepID=A0A0A7EJ64_9GAMM|nr:sigma-54 dependent transcriptional regulator [Pseudoalteromonas piratica]AIY66664.1 Fis family transcriptional regulator [Pseudoalteromonas piratica]